jgi:phospholipid-binding lipoprotein MlaA
MNKALATLFAGFISFATFPCYSASGSAALNSEIVLITKEGVKSVNMVGGRLPKNSTETYFLKSVVEVNKNRPLSKPKPTPSPKPKPSPVAKPLQAAQGDTAASAKKPTPLPSTPVPSSRKVGAIVKKEVQKRRAETAKAAPPVPQSEKRASEVSSGKTTPNITITKKAPVATVPIDEFDEYSEVASIPDAIEPVNRCFFWVNDQLYCFVFRPVSKAYRVLPKQARTAVSNVYENVEFPVRFVNDLLQFKFKNADLEFRKFLVNSVVGVGGIVRVSDRIPALANIPPADTGQTLAKWGVGHGCYIVLPVLGPSSARDTVGRAGDYALNPLTWVSFGAVSAGASIAITAPNAVNTMDARIDTYDTVTKNAIDPYQAVRSGYSQYRKKAASE